MTDIYDKQDYYSKYLEEKGVDLNNHFEISHLEDEIDLDPTPYYEFVDCYREECLSKFYGPRPFYNYDSMREAVFLSSIGYNEHNTFEYNYGIKEEHNSMLKEMLGDNVFEQLKIEKDTAGIRLLEYKPGNGIPLHTDSFNAFRTKNGIPDGEGSIHRYFIAVSPWSWGHFLQVHDNMIHHWKPGYVLEIPDGIFHTSANFGIESKLTLTVTGFRP